MAKIQKRDMRQQTMQKRIMQKGRTMVEMLGVLAVIGVLSIGGITGMRYAMQIYKENETLNAFSVATAGARTANLLQDYIYSCDNHYPCVVDPEQVISTKYEMTKEDFTTAVSAPVQVRIESPNGYTVRIRGISKELCESIKSGFWGETCAGVDRIGSNNTYRNNDCKALKSLDCDQFDDATTGLLRRSLLQENIENNDGQFISYQDTVNKYSALVLYYGEGEGSVEYVPDNPGSEDEKVPGHEENKDPDNKDPENPGGKDPENPGGKDPENPGYEDEDPIIPGHEDCNSKGGQLFGEVCCKGVINVLKNRVDKACCDGYQPKYGTDDGTCCKENPQYEWKEDKKVCCNGINDIATGEPSEACCTGDEYEWREEDGVGVCCKGSYDATGEINLKCVRCDTFGNDLISEVATEYCCQKDFGDQGGKWVWKEGSEGVSGVCCKPGTSADLSSHSVPTKECCEAINGEWKNGVCCKDFKNVDTNSVVKECCTGDEYEWKNGVCCNGVRNAETQQVDSQCCDGDLIGETCCKGIYDQSGQKNSACCNGSVETPGTSCGDDDVGFCCEAQGGTASCDKETKEVFCCKSGSSTDLTNGGSSERCCEQAGGDWKGSWCCAKWGRKDAQSGGMCKV